MPPDALHTKKLLTLKTFEVMWPPEFSANSSTRITRFHLKLFSVVRTKASAYCSRWIEGFEARLPVGFYNKHVCYSTIIVWQYAVPKSSATMIHYQWSTGDGQSLLSCTNPTNNRPISRLNGLLSSPRTQRSYSKCLNHNFIQALVSSINLIRFTWFRWLAS